MLSRRRPSDLAFVFWFDKNVRMKMTIELPDALVKQVKVRALRNGQKLKDAVADLLQKGLAVSDDRVDRRMPAVTTERQTGLPLVQCKRTASALTELTPERVAEILLLQDAEWHRAVGR